jgi:hypothetical protein
MVTTLKDFLDNQSIEHFVKKDTIEDLLNKIGIDKQKFVGIESTKIISDERFSVIFNTIKEGNGIKGRHIIDVISTEPTWQQLMDVTFGAGADCDTKIVIYDNSAQWNDRVSNRNTAAKFASINNDCGLDTYVLGATALERRNKDELKISYAIEASPKVGYETYYRKLPTKEEFEQAEFWLYFDEYSAAVQERIYNPDWWIGGPVVYFIDEVIDAFPIWNEDGIFMRATADNFSGHQTLIELLDTKRNEIEQHFKGCDLKIHWIPDSPIEITAKYDDRPFGDFVSMNIEEKYRCAGKCRNILSEFRAFFEELIDNIDRADQKMAV